MTRHRPDLTDTRHGMHCTCGVFCGHDIESWRAHRDDLLTLHPGADTRTDLAVMTEGIRAIGKAYARIFETGTRAAQQIGDALAANLRRSNERLILNQRSAALDHLNRPVDTP